MFVKAYKAKIEPKPTVQPVKPTVASIITAKDSGYTVIKHETSKETAVGEPVDKTIGQPTVQWTETIGKTPSQIHNPQPSLDKMEMRLPHSKKRQCKFTYQAPGQARALAERSTDQHWEKHLATQLSSNHSR